MKLRFATLEELFCYVEAITLDSHDPKKSWSVAQNLFHLAGAFEGSMTGMSPGYPAIIRFFIRPMRWIVTRYRFPPMLPIPSSAKQELTPPADANFEEQKIRLLGAIRQFEQFAEEHPAHPVLGQLTRAEWIGFHLRHCEHHLAFLETRTGKL
ncbi:MAG: DUF1569 domain-containing protein [Planctomycetota bacterium]